MANLQSKKGIKKNGLGLRPSLLLVYGLILSVLGLLLVVLYVCDLLGYSWPIELLILLLGCLIFCGGCLVMLKHNDNDDFTPYV